MSTVIKDNQEDENSTNGDNETCNNVDENVNDDESIHGSSLKRRIGKFRCLSNESPSNDSNLENLNNQEQQPQQQIKLSEPFIPPTLLTNSTNNQQEEKQEDIKQQENNEQSVKKGNKPGRKKGFKMKKIVVDDNDDSQSSLNRRRSSRLKNLEEKKEASSNNDSVIDNTTTEEIRNFKDSDLKTTNDDETSATIVNEMKTNDNNEIIDNTSPNKRKDKKKKDKKRSTKTDKHDKRMTRRKSSTTSKSALDENENYDDDNHDSNRPSSTDCFTPPSSVHNSSTTNDANLKAEKPEKVKSRWRRNSELESGHSNEPSKKDALSSSENLINNNDNLNSTTYDSSINSPSSNNQMTNQLNQTHHNENTEPMPNFQIIDYNIYLVEKKKNKSTKEIKKMVCDCILTKEERSRGIMGCGEDCLNRMLMIECGSRCPLNDHCANKRFLRKQYANVEAFKTARKGWGLRAIQPLQPGQFIMEYVGEVIGPTDFRNRVKLYSKEGHEHHFFMALKADEIIDATNKGNITRFVNHSCDPNAETQKWTVNGDLRIGFFSTKYIRPGEEITFDYQFQRYGKEAQRCYCESDNCRGFIGATDVSNEVDIEIEDESATIKDKTDKESADKLKEEFEDLSLEGEIDKLKSFGGLRNRPQTLMLARLMVRAEDLSNRSKLLEVILNTREQACLRLLLDYHGLQLLWSWMVDLEDINLKSEIIKVLEFLPIPNKTMIKDSKVYELIEKWSLDKEMIKEFDKEIKLKDKPPDKVIDNKQELNVEDRKLTNGDLNAEIDKSNETKQEHIVKEEDQTSELKSSLHKGFNIIKKDSKSTQDLQQQKSIPNIAMQATRLLNLWKDLKEVYRIPRLERQKRHEDEKEADRKALENEENNNTKIMNTPAFLRKNLKRPFDSVNKFATGVSGHKQQNQFYTQYSQNPQFNYQSINQNQNPSNVTPINNENNSQANKISKEEHRTYYNVELMRKDYEEAMKQYRKQIEQYNAAIQQQINNMNGIIAIQPIQPPMPPAPPNIYQTTHLQLSQTSTPSPLSNLNQYNNVNNSINIDKQQLQQSTNEFKIATPIQQTTNAISTDQHHGFSSQYSQQEIDYSTSLNQSNYAQQPQFDYQMQVEYNQPQIQQDLVAYNHLTTNYQQQNSIADVEFEDESQPQEELEKSWNQLYNELTAGLNGKSRKMNYVECTNDQHELNISDSLIPDHLNFSSTDEETQFDNLFLTSGTYFISTNENKTYFISSNSNCLSGEPIVIESNLELPSKELSVKALPKDWKYSKDKNGYYYYYNKTTNQVQWNVPSSNSFNTKEIQASTVTAKSDDSTPKIDANNFDLSSIDAATLNEIMKQFNSEDLSNLNLNNLTNIDLDPRKRFKSSSDQPDSQDSNAASSSLSLELENKIIKFPYHQQQQAKPSERSERKIKERFKTDLSDHIKNCLNPYRRNECKTGRILCIDDFKYLCRKLTHMIMVKELKHCRSIENLIVSDTVKHKSKEFVKKYLSVDKYQPFYKRDDEKLDDDEENAHEEKVMEQSIRNVLINSPGIYQHHNHNSNHSATNSVNTTPTQNHPATISEESKGSEDVGLNKDTNHNSLDHEMNEEMKSNEENVNLKSIELETSKT